MAASAIAASFFALGVMMSSAAIAPSPTICRSQTDPMTNSNLTA